MEIKKQIEIIKQSQDFVNTVSAMRDMDLRHLSPPLFAQISRHLERLSVTPEPKIAYLGNFVLDLLPSYVKVTAAKHGIYCGGYVGSYGQYFQEIMGEGSGLKSFAPDMIFLFLDMRELEPEIVHSFGMLNVERKKELRDNILKHIRDWTAAASKHIGGTLIVSNFAMPAYTQNGLADQTDSSGEMRFYYDLNIRLAEMFANDQSVMLFDLSKLTIKFGWEQIFDPKLYYMAKMLWSERFLPVVADEILRTIIAVRGMARKCLVLDLDNTLWGGIIGEDGVRGVKVGMGDPVSEAFLAFQLKVKTLKYRGILLAICSKNNESDVQEIFALRTEMPLSLDDFAASRINWENKAENIRSIALELNIGLDSIVFIDDNPAECALVRDLMPEVLTLQLPELPETMCAMIDQIPVFEKRTVLETDRQKTEQYRKNQQRQQLKNQINNLNDYLYSLQTEIVIKQPAEEDLERVHQLFTKTNQFNVTTIRYSLSEVANIYNNKENDLFIISAMDKFGDLGIVGLYLVRCRGTVATVDSFILSCRAMGRGIEDAIMNHLKQRCFERRNVETIEADYFPTKKNMPVENFFENQGFALYGKEVDGSKHYRLTKELSKINSCDWITVIAKEEENG